PQALFERHLREALHGSYPARDSRRVVPLGYARSGKGAAMSQTDFDPEYVFSHHDATPEKLAHYDAIHVGAKRFAEVILANVPAAADRSAALQLLRESTMTACAAVALDGRLK